MLEKCHQFIGILDTQLVLKFHIFNSIRVRVIRVYVIFTLSENRKFRVDLAGCEIF